MSNVVARLKVDEPPAAAASQLAALLSPLQMPARPSFALTLGDVSPTRAPELPADVRVSLWTMGMSALVLLVACGSAGNLLLLRRLRRTQEVSIKLALGASRARLVREVLADALVLAAMAGIATLVIALVGSRVVHDVLLPGLDDIAPLDLSRLLWLTVGVSFGAALVLSLAPAAWQARQRLTGQTVVMRVSRPSRVLGTFVALQVALSLPLMAAAALFVSSFRNARAQDFGFQADRVVVVETNTAEVGQSRAAHAVHTAIQERLRHMPGVEAASVVQASPTQGRVGFRVRPRNSPHEEPRTADFLAADAAYADVAGIRIVDGRALRETDDVTGSAPVVMVSASLASDAWPGRSAVGECLEMIGPMTECLTVVGVFDDVANRASLDWKNGTRGGWTVVGPLEMMGGTFGGRVVLVKTHAEPASMLASIRREAQQAAPNQPYIDVWPLDDVFEPMLRPWRLGSTVFVAFGVLTLVIAGVGLAVVTAYAVTRRTREIGIRAALGAAPADLVVLLVRQHLWAVGAGLVAGTGLTWLGGRWIQSLLYGVTPYDPRVIAFVATVFIITTTLAAWLPARRAGRVAPSAALRTE
ncbi:MAG: FtsX-like permease family protein [Acidobacteria bacterium]|nr:FtsX-like permease family protein [Acidobacteriota bacterium]